MSTVDSVSTPGGDDEHDSGAHASAAAAGSEGSERLGSADRGSEEGSGDGPRTSPGEADDVRGQTGGAASGELDGGPGPALPNQSPLFHAHHAGRYDRQAVIRAYQEEFGCRLIVVIDTIFPDGIAFLEDLIYDASPAEDLHVLLDSAGGDGETAVRMIRSMQARCRELTVIVPDQAKSAATLIALGAHHILMGPTSDLGPIDPQFRLRREGGFELVAAKDIVAAVDSAMEAVTASPDTFPLHASLLADVNALMVQSARTAILRSDDLLRESLESNPTRTPDDVARLCAALHGPLIEEPRSHAAPFGASDAQNVGLPILHCDPSSRQWQIIWRLYAKYLTINAPSIYEGAYASQVIRPMGEPHPH